MPRCNVCRHPQCNEFDEALALGKMTQAEVAEAIGVDQASVSRHFKNHVTPQVKQELMLADASDVGVLQQLQTLASRMAAHLEEAETAKDKRYIRAFHSELRKDLELLAKLMLVANAYQPLDITGEPEWIELRTAILLALQPYPEAKDAVLQCLV